MIGDFINRKEAVKIERDRNSSVWQKLCGWIGSHGLNSLVQAVVYVSFAWMFPLICLSFFVCLRVEVI